MNASRQSNHAQTASPHILVAVDLSTCPEALDQLRQVGQVQHLAEFDQELVESLISKADAYLGHTDVRVTEQLLAKISELNHNPDVHGILLQHPVPEQIDERACFDAISLEKDVDGVTCLGFGRMSMGEAAYGCATPKGIMRLLEHYRVELEGKHAVVVGRSAILGKPMAMMLLEANATVTICHSRTRNLPDLVKQADIVVGAVGKPEFIKADWIKDGAVVVDAGFHPEKCGDIELAPLVDRVSAYTPVPGGVGPMTINTLIFQTLQSGEKALG